MPVKIFNKGCSPLQRSSSPASIDNWTLSYRPEPTARWELQPVRTPPCPSAKCSASNGPTHGGTCAKTSFHDDFFFPKRPRSKAASPWEEHDAAGYRKLNLEHLTCTIAPMHGASLSTRRYAGGGGEISVPIELSLGLTILPLQSTSARDFAPPTRMGSWRSM